MLSPRGTITEKLIWGNQHVGDNKLVWFQHNGRNRLCSLRLAGDEHSPLLAAYDVISIGRYPQRVAESSLKMYLLRFGQGLGLWDKMVVKMGDVSQGLGICFGASRILNSSLIYSDISSLCMIFVFTAKAEGKDKISTVTGQFELVIRLRVALGGAYLAN